MQHLKIKSADGMEFVLTTEVAFRSKKIKETCQQERLNGTVTFSQVNGYLLEKVIDWMDHYKDGSIFDDDTHYKVEGDKFDKWDKEYLKVERETLFLLARAAHFMEIRGLVHYCAQTIADLMKDLDITQVRGFMGLPRLNQKAHRRCHGS